MAKLLTEIMYDKKPFILSRQFRSISYYEKGNRVGYYYVCYQHQGMNPRKPISKRTRRELIDFYGGKECVLNGTVPATLHHIDGDPSNSYFENLVPLQHEIHAKLKPPTGPRIEGILSTADGEMDPQHLRRIGRERYLQGKTTHAFACARLAHGVRHYYRRKNSEDEVRSLLDALYYLRRCFVLSPIKGFRLLDYILRHDLLPTLESSPVLSSTATVILLEEMGAWLNEFGQCDSAETILTAAQDRLKTADRPAIGELFHSGMFRQWAFCLIYRGDESSLVERALKQARDCDDSNHNRIGIINARTELLVTRGEGAKALDIVLPMIQKVNDAIDENHPHPEQIGCSYENYLGMLCAELLARVTMESKRGGKLIADRLRDFHKTEGFLRVQARLVWPPDIERRTLQVGANIPGFLSFVRSHTAPPLPSNLKDLCNSVAELVVRG